MNWNITAIANQWTGEAGNYGLVLMSPTENNSANFRVFPSSEDTDFNSPVCGFRVERGKACADTARPCVEGVGERERTDRRKPGGAEYRRGARRRTGP
ncbi:hypothetical protein [Streptosporangium sp. NPDC006930]|uniref:hypothetical protein n=1 Tax=unclassified Streptosporangium TaxID=2632669 RepID=UPI0034202FDA